MKRVLQITVGSMHYGGVQNFLINLYRHIDTEKVQFDFVLMTKEEGVYEKEILSKGGKIYRIPQMKNSFIGHYRALYKIIKENKYEIVHRHTTTSVCWPDLMVAKLAGAKKTISHSHSSFWKHPIIHKLCIPFLNVFSSMRLACGDLAGKWLYGKKEFSVINNGVVLEKFSYSKETRERIRKELEIEDKIVVGNVARLSYEKNQKFLIELLSEMVKDNPNVILLLIGDGPLRKELTDFTRELCVEGNVRFLGMRDDVNDLLQAMDVFVLPSLFEGFPISVVEALVSGMPCIISDKVSNEVDYKGLVSQIGLEEPLEVWRDSIFRMINIARQDRTIEMNNAGFGIHTTAQILENMYLE